MSDESEPGRPARTRSCFEVFGKNASDNIGLEIDLESD